MNIAMDTAAPRPPEPQRISEVLASLAAGDEADRIALGDLTSMLGDRAFGVMILLLALPNGVPGPVIPGFSLIFGLPMVLLALQMLFGRRTPWMPRRMQRWSFRRGRLSGLLRRAAPAVERLELYFRPRYPRLTTALAERIVGLLLIVFALILSLPIPFGNVPVAWAICIVAMGIMERDGLSLVIGALISIAAVVWNVFLVTAGITALQLLFDKLF